MNIYAPDQQESVDWVDLSSNSISSTLTWYQTYFDAPDGIDPVALDFGSMGKGLAWVNGHNIGRFWSWLLQRMAVRKLVIIVEPIMKINVRKTVETNPKMIKKPPVRRIKKTSEANQYTMENS